MSGLKNRKKNGTSKDSNKSARYLIYAIREQLLDDDRVWMFFAFHSSRTFESLYDFILDLKDKLRFEYITKEKSIE